MNKKLLLRFVVWIGECVNSKQLFHITKYDILFQMKNPTLTISLQALRRKVTIYLLHHQKQKINMVGYFC